MSSSSLSPAHTTTRLRSFSRRQHMLGAVTLTVALALTACGSTPSASSAAPDTPSNPPHPTSGSMQSGYAMGGMGASHGDPGRGLLATEDGYTLRPTSSALATGAQTVSFQILNSRGTPQTAYTPDQTKLLHFYLVRDDLSGYQHLHPSLSAGTWRIPLTVAAPGRYRMYADFIAKDGDGKDHPVVLSTTLTAPGRATPVPLPQAARSITTDGLTATVHGAAAAGKPSTLSISITADGMLVSDLQPYLDTYAHMTAVHIGDLAYEHVHPTLTAQPGKTGGPTLPFAVEFPEPGTWRLFLQVQRQGALRLLPLTIAAR